MGGGVWRGNEVNYSRFLFKHGNYRHDLQTLAKHNIVYHFQLSLT